MAQMLMALTLVGIYFAEPYMVGEEIDIERSADLLLWVFFVHNVFAVLQDVVSDALAVDLLSENEQGAVNGAMWASKLLGMALGAGVLATIMDQYGIQGAVAAQIIVLLLIMLVPLLLVERQGDKRFPWDVYGSSELEPSRQMRHRSIGEILHDVLRGFSMRTTMFFFMIVLLSLIGWGVMETILKTICNQQIGWSSTHTSVVMGYSYVPEAISAVLFGFLGDRFGRKKMMILGMGGYGLVSILFALGSDYWGNSYPTDWAADGYWDNHIVWLYVVGYKVLLAIFVVNYLAESMALSWTSSSATMFTIFMTLSNVGHVLGNLMAGDVERIFGAAHSFIAMGIFNIVILSLLIYVRREDVTERISEEEAIVSG